MLDVKKILEDIKNGVITTDEAYDKLKHLPFSDIDFAKIDNHRFMRKGFPEVIFCQGKQPAQIERIASELVKNGSSILATRADSAAFEAVKKASPSAVYHEDARVVVVDNRGSIEPAGKVAVLSAGTADIPVAQEAAITAEMLNANVDRVYDVGVAGLHRLLSFYDRAASANALVVVAGMDGVLPSVVGGIVSCPVIAVPTSIGYGAHFGGLAPLLTMLNSCAPGVSVVNIDNGFGAGYVAAMINNAISGQANR
ncbi:MAG: nickel pincer cofactor biosynthesis protein LarB [Rubrobacteridae bacterium]|nr:nickel pincer cofactor biosynthesis protein LarB [Rubrobacteridae bacterium]